MDEEMILIPISNSIYAVLKRRENYLCSLLQKKFGCICVLKSIRNPMEIYRKSLKEGVEVSVWVDDLTRHEADALVNAANEYLHHFGGLAFALLKAGGPEIEEQCKLFIEKNGPLSAGQIVVTSGGRLPCKQVIHAVGPRWSEDQKEECCLKLEAAIINVLKYVNAPENNIKSVAIPALSSGIFNFPQDWCAQVIVQTIRNFVQLAPLFGYLQEIHLVNIDETTADVMKRACEDLIGINDIVPQSSITDSITVNELCLQIKKGDIEAQQAAIIINSVTVQDGLFQGLVSRAILEKAGPAMQEQFLSELQKLPSERPNFIYTKGFNLDCEHVLHVVWPSYIEGSRQEVLKTAISKGLSKTGEQQLSSIAFPPLGIKDLHLPSNEVAEIMVEEIMHFAVEQTGKKLDVYIVISLDNSDVYEEFFKTLKSYEYHRSLENTLDVQLPVQDRNPHIIPDKGQPNAFCAKLMSVKNKLEEKMDCSNIDRMAELQTDVQANSGFERNGPFVELIGRSHDILEKAGQWLRDIILVEETGRIVIRNHNILNLRSVQPLELSHLQQHFGITILESVSGAGTALEIEGSPRAVIDAVFAIEFMLQSTAKQEPLKIDGSLESHLHQEGDLETANRCLYQITPIESYLQEFKDKEKQLEKAGLQVLKIEKIHNPLLESAFQRVKRKIEGRNTGMPVCHRLYHHVPAQYCSLVCKTGFQKTYSSSQGKPHTLQRKLLQSATHLYCYNKKYSKTACILYCFSDQKYGTGIYFKKNPRKLIADTREKCEMDHLICVFEAEVVTGSYTRGNRSYVAPPLINTSSMKLYDSVVDDIHNPEIFVIFNKEQALPLYLLTCSLLWSPDQKANLEPSS
ncbi:PREDICTED: poly [ADP-ribose] polymerase 9 [Thamnophis sirtalis]|uniref:Poly [ADP-ribose] polymerase 9 n=1 Tax=Thamnophis sirtalis TaxID=35019 RepID=A0A6I9Y5P9_9SAUR|nr:PREDICTED: poly [ADP-ribose] polymerase 9 [Thamnophis sirtalis]